jgi:hypothetical protein
LARLIRCYIYISAFSSCSPGSVLTEMRRELQLSFDPLFRSPTDNRVRRLDARVPGNDADDERSPVGRGQEVVGTGEGSLAHDGNQGSGGDVLRQGGRFRYILDCPVLGVHHGGDDKVETVRVSHLDRRGQLCGARDEKAAGGARRAGHGEGGVMGGNKRGTDVGKKRSAKKRVEHNEKKKLTLPITVSLTQTLTQAACCVECGSTRVATCQLFRTPFG